MVFSKEKEVQVKNPSSIFQQYDPVRTLTTQEEINTYLGVKREEVEDDLKSSMIPDGDYPTAWNTKSYDEFLGLTSIEIYKFKREPDNVWWIVNCSINKVANGRRKSGTIDAELVFAGHPYGFKE